MREKPPPINYATHLRYSACISGGSQTSSMVPQPFSAVPPPINYTTHPNFPKSSASFSGSQIVTAVAPPTQSNQPVLPVEKEINSLDDALDDALIGFSINDTVIPIPLPCRHGNAKYYSVVVGRCCGVYSSWLVKLIIHY
jgi:hypothetical protein